MKDTYFVKKLNNIVFNILKVFNSVLLIFMSLLVFIEVFSRYFILKSHSWSEELLRYILVWMTFMSLSVVSKEDNHLKIKVFYKYFSPRWRFKVHIISETLTIITSIIFVILGFFYAIRFRYDYSPILDISYGIVYACVPIGFLCLTFQIMIDLWLFIKSNNNGEA